MWQTVEVYVLDKAIPIFSVFRITNTDKGYSILDPEGVRNGKKMNFSDFFFYFLDWMIGFAMLK